jgi:hypothetical protein
MLNLTYDKKLKIRSKNVKLIRDFIYFLDIPNYDIIKSKSAKTSSVQN